jgi:hypothetical protein
MAKRETTIAKELATAEKILKSGMKKSESTKEKLRSKIARLKKEARGIPMTAKQLANATLRQSAKLKELSLRDFKDLIRRLSKKPEYTFLKSMSRDDIQRDLSRKAKPVGWRFKGRGDYRTPSASQTKKGRANGSVYYEARANRSDVSSALKLNTGGEINKEQADFMADQIVIYLESKGLVKGSESATQKAIAMAIAKMGRTPYVTGHYEDEPIYAGKGKRMPGKH